MRYFDGETIFNFKFDRLGLGANVKFLAVICVLIFGASAFANKVDCGTLLESKNALSSIVYVQSPNDKRPPDPDDLIKTRRTVISRVNQADLLRPSNDIVKYNVIVDGMVLQTGTANLQALFGLHNVAIKPASKPDDQDYPGPYGFANATIQGKRSDIIKCLALLQVSKMASILWLGKSESNSFSRALEYWFEGPGRDSGFLIDWAPDDDDRHDYQGTNGGSFDSDL